MHVDRRQLLSGGGAVLATMLSPRAAEALERSEALFLAPCRRPDGGFSVLVIGETGGVIREVMLPARGHDLAVHAPTGRAVAFARRPGTFAVAFEVKGRAAPEVLVSRPDRHFFGHGAFSQDGQLLFATENDFDANRGVIGVYDVAGGYVRIGEFETRGIGTHEAILLPDGRTLAVANGGIETHPSYGREMLNLPTMDPSLSFIDARTGDVLAQHRLGPDLHNLSIRHMTVDGRGAIWFGTQWEGDPRETPSLVGRASLDGGLHLVDTPAAAIEAMRHYIGAMTTTGDGSVICASAPRGNLIAYWSAETGAMLGSTAIEDASGVTGLGATTIAASNGAGRVVEAAAGGEAQQRFGRPGTAFDNHLRNII